ncbi:unnamed protein product, partial [Effrenium voratum]
MASQDLKMPTPFDQKSSCNLGAKSLKLKPLVRSLVTPGEKVVLNECAKRWNRRLKCQSLTWESLNLVAVLCTVFLATWQLLRRKRATCPAVPGVLVLGNLPELLKAALSNRHLEMFVRHHRQLGQTIVYSLPLKPEIVVTTNPRNVEHMLKGNFGNFVKGWWSR